MSNAPVAIVLAAGQGTRMRSRRPKVLFEVLGRSIVRRVVDAAQDAGCEEVVVVVGHGADDVRAELADVPGLRFAVQQQRRGTGDAVGAARGALDYVGRTVVVLPADVPLLGADTLAGLLGHHAELTPAVTVATLRLDDCTGYGRVVRDSAGEQVIRIVEHRDATPEELAIDEVNSAIYAFEGGFLFGEGGDGGALARLSPDNDQGEYYLTDVVAEARRAGLDVRPFQLADPYAVAGVNTRVQLAEIEAVLRRRTNRALMEAGVSMDDPGSVRVEEGALLGRDVSLGAGVELRGACRLGDGVRVGRGTVLRDTEVGDDAVVGEYVVIERARIEAGAQVLPFTFARGIHEKQPHLSSEAEQVIVGEGARVGPFSHLRQAAVLGAGAHVGNFVELKKSTLHDGAKANHLAYLGDATVGAGSNIGAGVITCNYDGVAKHPTRVGEDAFVGTGCYLVAPVRIGDDAYVGTGTTVTRDVPAGDLAIGRARQENKKGYGLRLKASLKRKADKLAQARAEVEEQG